MNEEIIGGVSPLKRKAGRAKTRRGGAEAGKATAKKGNWLGGRGGYKKASGKQGTGVNRGGYNVHTRFKVREKPDAPKGGVTGGGDPTSNKPYSYDKDGNIVIHNNNIINTAGGTNTNINKNINTNTNNVKNENDKIKEKDKERSGTETRRKKESLPTYREAWDMDNDGVRTSGKYKTFEEFEKAAIEWNRKHGTSTSEYGESRTWTQKQVDGVWQDKVYSDWERD